MEFNDFREDFLETAKALAEADHNFASAAFTEIAARKLMDAEELANFESCYFEGSGKRNRKLRVDGFAYDEAEDSVKLLITDFRGGKETATLSQSEAERQFEILRAFVEDAVSGQLHPELEESSSGFGLSNDLYHKRDQTLRYKLYLVTDCILSSRVKEVSMLPVMSRPVECHVWDMSRFHRAFESLTGREELDISFEDLADGGLPCLEAGQAANEYMAYLCAMPGRILAEVYEKYGSKLLEGNVRSFLSTKGKINKGIRATILRQPEMFFAFNNGISATASEATVYNTDKGLKLVGLKGLQIVNGGQTTASLAAALREKTELEKIYVQMKLSVITPVNAERVIPEISRCANSQNKVSEADFFSNHPFHIRMEQFSRRIYAPPTGGAQYQTRWYYERARGQYLNEQTKMTKKEKTQFVLQNPRDQQITKTDLAKYYNSWRGLPHIVSLGAQKNFREFAEWVSAKWEESDTIFHEEFYRESVALAILFNHTERLVTEQPWYQSGYRANIVAYTIAKLARMIGSRGGMVLDLRGIWDRQSVSEPMKRQIAAISKEVFNVIVSPAKEFQNITEWCKKKACWDRVNDLDIVLLAEFEKELLVASRKKELEKDAKEKQIVDNGIDVQMTVVAKGAEYWNRVRMWAKQHRLVTGDEDKLLGVAAKLSVGMMPDAKQCRKLLVVKDRVEKEGFLG